MQITEKYRPKTWDELVPPENLLEKINRWRINKQLDSHLIFYGHAGTGKSSTARIILRELGITDYIIRNGSDDTSVDDARSIIEWASQPSMTNQKVCLIEEFERMTPQAQDSLKYALEAYGDRTIFIFTTNNVKKITDPIQSRCEIYCFDDINKEKFTIKFFQVCSQEGLFANGQFTSQEEAVLFSNIIEKSYPDFRKAFNTLNKLIVDENGIKKLKGDISSINNSDESEILDVVNKVKNGNIFESMVSLANMNSDSIEKAYRVLYTHLTWFTDDKDKWRKILLAIQKYNYQHQCLIADYDMNLDACITECVLIADGVL